MNSHTFGLYTSDTRGLLQCESACPRRINFRVAARWKWCTWKAEKDSGLWQILEDECHLLEVSQSPDLARWHPTLDKSFSFSLPYQEMQDTRYIQIIVCSAYFFLRSHLWEEFRLFKSYIYWLQIHPAITTIIPGLAVSTPPYSWNQPWWNRELPSNDFCWGWCSTTKSLWLCVKASGGQCACLWGQWSLSVWALSSSVPQHIGTFHDWPYVLVYNFYSHSQMELWGQAPLSHSCLPSNSFHTSPC